MEGPKLRGGEGGGLQNGRGGGQVKFYPDKKGGGAEKVLAIVMGRSFKTVGCKKFYPVLRGGGAHKVLDL